MAITVIEGFQRGDLDGQSGSTSWIIRCATTDTQAAVRAALKAAAPSTYGNLILDDVRVKHIMDDLYAGEALYKSITRQNIEKVQEDEGYVLDFDTTGQTQHINASESFTLYTSPAHCPSGDADNTNVIGFDGQKIHGVDVVSGVYNFTEEWQLPSSTVTATYRKNLAFLTGKVNNAAFREFAAGEVLFMGATGRRIKEELFSITFRFAVSPNVTGLTIGDITGIAKGGWDYIDTRFTDGLLSESVAQVPKQVKVHKVYKLGNFSILPSV